MVPSHGVTELSGLMAAVWLASLTFIVHTSFPQSQRRGLHDCQRTEMPPQKHLFYRKDKITKYDNQRKCKARSLDDIDSHEELTETFPTAGEKGWRRS